MKTKVWGQNWGRSLSRCRSRISVRSLTVKEGIWRKLPLLTRGLLTLMRLLDLDTGADTNIVLPLAVKESRQVIDLHRAHVEMFSRMHVQTSADGHGKRRVTLATRHQRIIKLCAHVRDPKQGVHKRRHAVWPPVITRTGHQIVTLHSSIKRPARVPIDVTGRGVRAGKAGDNPNVTGYVLVELSVEAVVSLALRSKIDRPAIEGGGAVPIYTVGIVVGSVVSIADIKLVL